MNQPSIECPKCRKVSYNPNDIEDRYCAHCNNHHYAIVSDLQYELDQCEMRFEAFKDLVSKIADQSPDDMPIPEAAELASQMVQHANELLLKLYQGKL